MREVVRRVAADQAALPPVVRQTDLVDGAAALHRQRPDALGDQHACLDRGTGGVDRRPAAVLQADFASEIGMHFAEHLRLELGEIRHAARHPAGGVVLG